MLKLLIVTCSPSRGSLQRPRCLQSGSLPSLAHLARPSHTPAIRDKGVAHFNTAPWTGSSWPRLRGWILFHPYFPHIDNAIQKNRNLPLTWVRSFVRSSFSTRTLHSTSAGAKAKAQTGLPPISEERLQYIACVRVPNRRKFAHHGTSSPRNQ